MPTESIWPIIASSSVGAAVLTQLFAEARERWRGRNEAPYSALYLALALEDYARQCETYLSDVETFWSSDEQTGKFHSSMPELAPYPAEIDWKRVGVRLFEKAFGFRVLLSEVDREIYQAYYFDPPDGGDQLLTESLASKGLTALNLGAEIRKKHKLAKLKSESQFSTRSYLTLMQERAEERRRVELASQLEAQRLMDQAAARPA